MHSNWETVIGQARVKTMLQSAIRNRRVAHAYLFYGSEGTGKEALAIEFARVLLCRTQGETACGECTACRKMVTLHHPDVSLIFPLPGSDSSKSEEQESPDADVYEEVRKQISAKAANPYFHIAIPKAKVIPIRSVRAIKKESSMSASEAGKKIFIVFDADTLKEEAANALLKVLEEPLEGVHFLLVTSRKDALQQTIVSRCQRVRCSLLTDDDIAEALRTRLHIDDAQAQIVSTLANGNYARALELLGDDIARYRNDAVKFLRSILGSSSLRLLDEQEEYFSGNKRENAEQLLTMLLVWFRDTIVLREGAESTVMNRDQESDLKSFVGKFGEKNLELCLSSVERSLELLRRNVYLPLVMLSLTVQLRTILHARKV